MVIVNLKITNERTRGLPIGILETECIYCCKCVYVKHSTWCWTCFVCLVTPVLYYPTAINADSNLHRYGVRTERDPNNWPRINRMDYKLFCSYGMLCYMINTKTHYMNWIYLFGLKMTHTNSLNDMHNAINLFRQFLRRNSKMSAHANEFNISIRKNDVPQP